MKGFGAHRGVLDAGIIILGAIIVIIAIIAATLSWSDILQLTYVSLISSMPKFDYHLNSGLEAGNKNFELYSVLRSSSFLLLVFVLMFAGISVMFEKINLVPPQTAFKIISKSVYFVFFFFFFPPLWDAVSTGVEQFSWWILNPDDPSQPAKNVEVLLKKLGSIECADPNDPQGNCQFTLDKLVSSITDPFGLLKNIFQTSFLGIFKAIAFLIFMFLSFLVGTIRQVLTTIIMVGLPVLMVLSLLPFFKKIVSKFTEAFVGLLIAPIFSSLVVVAGVAYIGTMKAPEPIVEWFSALAIMSLSMLVPVMMVPLIGPILGVIQGMVSTATSTGGIILGLGGLGIARNAGAIPGALQQIRHLGSANADIQRSIFPPAGFGSIINSESKIQNAKIPQNIFDYSTGRVSNDFTKPQTQTNQNGANSIPRKLFDESKS